MSGVQYCELGGPVNAWAGPVITGTGAWVVTIGMKVVRTQGFESVTVSQTLPLPQHDQATVIAIWF